ncbi:MAG: acyltransferase [Thiotrichales bacterium]
MALPVQSDPKKALLLTALVGALPLSIGIRLREWLYRPLLGSLGKTAKIQPRVELIGLKQIYLGNRVQLWSNVTLSCWTGGSSIRVDDDVVMDRGIYLQGVGGRIEIGPRSYIGPYVCMSGPGNVTIGADCLIASHSTLYANNHVFSDPSVPINQQSLESSGIEIGDDCWLGSGVRVMDGVRIGRGCVVGAGAVVTRDLPDFSIAVGVPARVISSRASHEDRANVDLESLAGG